MIHAPFLYFHTVSHDPAIIYAEPWPVPEEDLMRFEDGPALHRKARGWWPLQMILRRCLIDIALVLHPADSDRPHRRSCIPCSSGSPRCMRGSPACWELWNGSRPFHPPPPPPGCSYFFNDLRVGKAHPRQVKRLSDMFRPCGTTSSDVLFPIEMYPYLAASQGIPFSLCFCWLQHVTAVRCPALFLYCCRKNAEEQLTVHICCADSLALKLYMATPAPLNVGSWRCTPSGFWQISRSILWDQIDLSRLAVP